MSIPGVALLLRLVLLGRLISFVGEMESGCLMDTQVALPYPDSHIYAGIQT